MEMAKRIRRHERSGRYYGRHKVIVDYSDAASEHEHHREMLELGFVKTCSGIDGDGRNRFIAYEYEGDPEYGKKWHRDEDMDRSRFE